MQRLDPSNNHFSTVYSKIFIECLAIATLPILGINQSTSLLLLGLFALLWSIPRAPDWGARMEYLQEKMQSMYTEADRVNGIQLAQINGSSSELGFKYNVAAARRKL